MKNRKNTRYVLCFCASLCYMTLYLIQTFIFIIFVKVRALSQFLMTLVKFSKSNLREDPDIRVVITRSNTTNQQKSCFQLKYA